MSLSDYFRSQADWRQRKAEEYPDDARNAQSAAALYSLAEYVEPDERGDHEAEGVDALLPHLFEGFSLGGEEAHRAVSRYGFGYTATAPTQHIEFLEGLQVSCMEDAYEFARDAGEGDDPTETLWPCELEAARRGVFLPTLYFERRRNSTEAECEEWVEQELERWAELQRWAELERPEGGLGR